MRALAGPLAPGAAVDDEALEALYAHGEGTVRVGMLVSLDGAVEADGRSGSLGGEEDRGLLAALRAAADVVLVAAGTVRSEGYGPAWLGPSRRSRRGRRGQGPLPTVAVVTASAGLAPSHRLFGERRDDQPEPPRPIVITTEQAESDPLRAVADVVTAGRSSVDLRVALALLARRGLRRVLCEGGPTLVASLAAAGLIDEMCLTHAPTFVGPGHVTLAGSGPSLDHRLACDLAHLLLTDDGMLAARYVVRT